MGSPTSLRYHLCSPPRTTSYPLSSWCHTATRRSHPPFVGKWWVTHGVMMIRCLHKNKKRSSPMALKCPSKEKQTLGRGAEVCMTPFLLAHWLLPSPKTPDSDFFNLLPPPPLVEDPHIDIDSPLKQAFPAAKRDPNLACRFFSTKPFKLWVGRTPQFGTLPTSQSQVVTRFHGRNSVTCKGLEPCELACRA